MNGNGSYTGKVAFVTGAGNGIGRAAALAFAREGASVVVADGVIGLSKSAALDYAPQNVRINAVCPASSTPR